MNYKYNNFLNIINDILDNQTVQSLKLYKHHYGYNRLDHCISVAYYTFLVCKFFKLDYISATRGALLHDLFLYDCEFKPKFHIWKHPKVALTNAQELFALNCIEKDVILKHMWPITFVPPKYIESLVVSFVDKFCAFKEWSNYCKNVIIYYSLVYFCTYKS